MDKSLLEPITEADVNAMIKWDAPLYSEIPVEARPAIVTFETAVIGIEDCFDCMDGESIRSYAAMILEKPGETLTIEIDSFIRAYVGMLDNWLDAIDGLDARLRGDVCAGGVPEWAELYLKSQASSLFHATTALQRAVVEYHHGSAGPRLSEDYGDAYALSNSALSPF